MCFRPKCSLLLLVLALPTVWGQACPAADRLGYFCQGGFAYPCLPGYFGSSTGLTTPTCSGVCSAAPGYGCPAGSTSAAATLCRVGYFCPGGTPAPAVRCGTPANCATTGLSAEPLCVWNVTTLAGNASTAVYAISGRPTSADGLGTLAMFWRPAGISAGTSAVYVADLNNNLLRRVSTPLGAVSTLAGSGVPAYVDGTGAGASFWYPSAVAVHPLTSDVYCSDNFRIRRVTSAGVTTTFAGNGNYVWADGSGTSASFAGPSGLAFDSAGVLFVADTVNNRVRKITPLGAVTTLAGTGSFSPFANGVGTSSATFSGPIGIAVDGSGNVLVGDSGNNRLRVVTPAAVVSTFAGSGDGAWADGTGTAAAFFYPEHLALTGSGSLLAVDSSNRRLRVVTPAGTVTTVAGGESLMYSDGIGTLSVFVDPVGVAVNANGTVFVSDRDGSRIRSLTCTPCPASFYCPAGVPLLCPAGAFCPPSSTAPSPCPSGTFSAATGALSNATCIPCTAQPGYACPAGSSAPSLCAPGFYCPGGAQATPFRCGIPSNCGAGLSAEPQCYWSSSTLAGSGASGTADGVGTLAKFSALSGVAVDLAGAVYVAQSGAHSVRKVTPAGAVSTLAGSGVQGSVDGAGTGASFAFPQGIAIHPLTGDVFCADSGNDRIRRITTAGATTTFAGGNPNFYWADGTGSSAGLSQPCGVAFDPSGTLYVADRGNNRIRKVSPLGAVTTLAGTGECAAPSSCTPALANGIGTSMATFSGPAGIAVDASGTVLVLELANRIRMITPAAVVTTLAGSGDSAWVDGSGTAAAFSLFFPSFPAFAANGNLVVPDGGNNRLRMVTPLGSVFTAAGGVAGSLDGTGTFSQFNSPVGVAASSNGTLYVSDIYNNRIRALVCAACPAGYECTSGGPLLCPAGSFCPPASFTASVSPAGFFSGPGAASATPCPIGSFCPTTRSAAPQLCAPGSYSSVAGRASCILCPPGLLAPHSGSTLCDNFCPVGTYRSRPGGANVSSCTPCPPGMFGEAEGATSCTPCPLGTAGGTLSGANSSSACTLCAPGTFSASLTGATVCSACPPGTFAGTAGLSACLLCPYSTYFAGTGAVDSVSCLPCPAGTTTTAEGSTSLAACITGATYQCIPGTQPKARTPPASQGDCVPLLCPSPLALNPGGTLCVGCGSGSVAAAGACTLCPAGTLCPGLLTTPLLNFSQPTAAASTCRFLTPTAMVASPKSSAWSISDIASLAGGIINGLFLLITVAVFSRKRLWQCISTCRMEYCSAKGRGPSAENGCTSIPNTTSPMIGMPYPTTSKDIEREGSLAGKSPGCKLPVCREVGPPCFHLKRLLCCHWMSKKCLLRFDCMSTTQPITFGADRALYKRDKSTLGVSTTLLAGSVLLALGAALVTQRIQSNTLLQQSLSLLRNSNTRNTASWAWAQASAEDIAASNLPLPASGVFLRFTVSGEPGQCMPVGLTSSGLSAGSWMLLPSPACAGTPYPLSQFTLACPQCMLTATSSLNFTLPYSCQSLVAEAGAVDADGSVTVLSLPPDSTVSPGGGLLLSSLTWTLSTLLSQLNNTVDPKSCRRGWQLISEGSQTTMQRLQGPLGSASGSLSLLPLSSAVSISVTLALQPFVATTTLSELTTPLQLVSNIASFREIVWLFCGMLFTFFAKWRKQSEVRSQRTPPPSAMEENKWCCAGSRRQNILSSLPKSHSTVRKLWQQQSPSSTELPASHELSATAAGQTPLTPLKIQFGKS